MKFVGAFIAAQVLVVVWLIGLPAIIFFLVVVGSALGNFNSAQFPFNIAMTTIIGGSFHAGIFAASLHYCTKMFFEEHVPVLVAARPVQSFLQGARQLPITGIAAAIVCGIIGFIYGLLRI